MISLDNTYNNEDLKDFDMRVIKNLDNTSLDSNNNSKEQRSLEYMIEFKFDGLGIELVYKD
jgi:NAD-dependent DNA ligase